MKGNMQIQYFLSLMRASSASDGVLGPIGGFWVKRHEPKVSIEYLVGDIGGCSSDVILINFEVFFS